MPIVQKIIFRKRNIRNFKDFAQNFFFDFRTFEPINLVG